MIILRDKLFSNTTMVNRLVKKLDAEGIEDYEVSGKILKDAITVDPDLTGVKIYIPLDLEYSQYGIDDFIRSMVSHIRTTTVLDRDIYVMKLSSKLNEDQIYRLIKHIISEEEFCCILNRL